ncbi:hypothetical protein [Arhodomonas sp. AD133]
MLLDPAHSQCHGFLIAVETDGPQTPQAQPAGNDDNGHDQE